MKDSLYSACQTNHNCTYNIPSDIPIHIIKHIYFFGVMGGCFRHSGRSDKCIRDLLKYHFVFLAILDLNKSKTCWKYKVMFSQIYNSFARPASGSNASNHHSKNNSVFDDVNKNKCLGDPHVTPKKILVFMM